MGKDGIVFRSLNIAGWRQFQSVNIDFHPRLTVITGTNGAGKSTILNVLSTHLGPTREYYSLPQRVGDQISYLPGGAANQTNVPNPRYQNADFHYVADVEYTNGVKAKFKAPKRPELLYNLDDEDRQDVTGVHIPSHRLMPNHAPLSTLPFTGVEPNASFRKLFDESYHSGNSILSSLKHTLASWAAIGEGNTKLTPRPNQLAAYDGFMEVLKRIVPPEIGFQRIIIEPPDILVKTETGTFVIDSCSGGLLTLIEIAAIIYTCSLRNETAGARFVVTIDEPENHLHPSMQRTLLPTLVNAFPDVQFIVATHSPFVVSSLKDSSVYVLKYTDSVTGSGQDLIPVTSRRIESLRLESFDRSGNASEILREVLGLTVTFPQWVEANLEDIVVKYEHSVLTADVIKAMKSDIEKAGLEDMFSEALTLLGERK